MLDACILWLFCFSGLSNRDIISIGVGVLLELKRRHDEQSDVTVSKICKNRYGGQDEDRNF